MSAHVNTFRTRTGKVSAVCVFCDRKSRPVEPHEDGEPGLFDLAVGWGTCPCPANFVHPDGSMGSLYECPVCIGRLDRGESLRQRGEQRR